MKNKTFHTLADIFFQAFGLWENSKTLFLMSKNSILKIPKYIYVGNLGMKNLLDNQKNVLNN